jgi:hypothetical protein
MGPTGPIVEKKAFKIEALSTCVGNADSSTVRFCSSWVQTQPPIGSQQGSTDPVQE